MTLPPIPASVPSPLGPVPVLIVENLHEKHQREDCLGYFNPVSRTVEIDPEAVLVVQWHTYYHEAMHVALWDAGLNNVLSEEQIEQVCDVSACQRVAELLSTVGAAHT